MNRTHAGVAPGAPTLRVRQQARDVLALMVFSAAASGACAVALFLLLALGE